MLKMIFLQFPTALNKVVSKRYIQVSNVNITNALLFGWKCENILNHPFLIKTNSAFDNVIGIHLRS